MPFLRFVHAAVMLLGLLAAASDRARGRSRERARRCVRDRPHRRHRTPEDRRRHPSGFHCARRRRHRPPHRRARARRRRRLGDLRARQFRRRADRPPDRRAALSHGGLRPVLARPRHLARGEHHAEFRRPAGAAGLRNRRYFPRHARSRHRHHLCRGTAHRQPAADLSVGARRLQGQGQFASRSTTASSSALPACSRCSSPSCSSSRAA